ncbi:Divergent polysaccharide deacetylase [compost metagenome]
MPVLTADRIVDRDRGTQAIERELMALEAIAHARGLAIGVASAFPASVETIARWARAAQARGIVIVPASAAVDS